MAESRMFGLLAEFETPQALSAAAREVRDAGFSLWDAHTPYPVHGLEDAMGIRMTALPWLVFFGGAAGALVGLGMQVWMNGEDYKFLTSGKPFWSIPAFIPITFEVTVLFSALTAFFGMLALNGLPRFYHPLFRSERFKRVTTDRFFISIDASDPEFAAERTKGFLVTLGARHVEEIGE